MLERVLRPIVTSAQPEWPKLPEAERAAVREVALRDTAAAIRAAPPLFRIAVSMLAAGAAADLALRGPSAGLGGPFRAFDRLVRSLTLLSTYEHPSVKRVLDVEAGPDRQARMRARRAAGAET